MNENAKAWIAALRSGKYKQGFETLRREDDQGLLRYCCLGVACDLAAQAGIGHWNQGKDEYDYWDAGKFIADYEEDAEYLPVPVQKWLGVTNPNPSVNNRSATGLNDSREKSFEDIANWLEENAEVIFK